MLKEDVHVNSSQGGFADSSYDAVVKTFDAVVKKARSTSARDLYLRPTPRNREYYPPPDGWIYWMSWGTINTGDCRMEGAILHLYPDGMIFFQAVTYSSSSGDVWLMKGIQFVDQFNHPVGQSLPQHNGMNMAWEGSEYPLIFWDAIPGVTSSGAAQIRGATMTNHC